MKRALKRYVVTLEAPNGSRMSIEVDAADRDDAEDQASSRILGNTAWLSYLVVDIREIVTK